MNYDTVPKFVIAISVVAVIVQTMAIVMVATNDTEDRYRLYIHMQKQEDTFKQHMRDIITSEYGTGFTMYWADGAYVDGSDTVQSRTVANTLTRASFGEADAIVESALEQREVVSVTKETYRSTVSVI